MYNFGWNPGLGTGSQGNDGFQTLSPTGFGLQHFTPENYFQGRHNEPWITDTKHEKPVRSDPNTATRC